MQNAPPDAMIEMLTKITCPECDHKAVEEMPTDACQYFYECKGCGKILKPLAGDCCVFCSYATVPCPPIQAARIEAKHLEAKHLEAKGENGKSDSSGAP